jgi:hypothetical protein
MFREYWSLLSDHLPTGGILDRRSFDVLFLPHGQGTGDWGLGTEDLPWLPRLSLHIWQ